MNRPIVAVVDDDAAVRAALQRLLLSMNLRVDAFSSAEEFLTSTDPALYDCVLLDVRMRGMSGLDLSRHLEATYSELPVILLTAETDPAVFVAGARLADAILHKPVDAAVLAGVLEQTMDVVMAPAG